MDGVRIELSVCELDVLVPYMRSIEECFGVEIVCENVSRDQRDGADHGRGEHLTMVPPTNFKLSANSQDAIIQAKAFLESVTFPRGAGPCERHLTLTPERFSALLPIYHAVQEETRTVFRLDPHTRAVSILGPAPRVNMAQSLATQRLGEGDAQAEGGTGAGSDRRQEAVVGAGQNQHFSPRRKARAHSQTLAPTLTVQMGVGTEGEEAGRGASSVGLSLSPGAESAHDSCYDSDGSPTGSRRGSSDLHTDVSRTVSDTLAAERSETDTPTGDAIKVTSPGAAGGSTATSRGVGGGVVPPGLTMTTMETLDVPEVGSCLGADLDAPTGVACPVSAGFGVEEDAECRYETLVKQETLEFSPYASPGGAEAEVDASFHQYRALRHQRASSSELVGEASSDAALAPVAGSAEEEETTLGLRLSGVTLDASSVDDDDVTGDGYEDEGEEDIDLKAVRYGIRLGYSQELIRRVLVKVGPDVNKDALLQELILHTEGEKEDDDGEEEEVVDCPWVLPPTVSDTPEEVEDEVDGGKKILSRTWSGAMTGTGMPFEVTGGGGGGSNLRSIIIDGSNIAMSHGNKQVFSCRGIRLAVDYFRSRGHEKVTVFVPSWRKEASRQDTQILDQELLYALEKEKALVFTPSRWVSGKRIVCYDDLYIIKLAAEDDGIVVSNDNYRDLINKSPEYKRVIEERLLMYSFVNDRFMPPDDPLGRHGPSLDNFLSKQPVVPEPLPPTCPYGKKCTYGNKCKYYHPERGSAPRKSVIEVLQEKEKVEIAKVRTKSRESSPGDVGPRGKSPTPPKKPLVKTQSLSPVPKQLRPANKTSLSRTRSLAVGTLGGPMPPDSLHLMALAGQSGAMPHTLNNEVQGGCKVTVTTTTPTDTAELNRQSYDDRLSRFRKEVEHSEAEWAKQEKEGTGFRGETLRPIASWSAPHDSLRKLQPLRLTNSDPLTAAQLTSQCGHLSLAKKLSDEGKDEEKRNTGHTARGGQASPNTSPLHHADDNSKNNGHRKLARQLSLQGSEDPRIQPKPAMWSQSQKAKKEKKPNNSAMFQFHGPAGPVPWYPQDNKSHTAPLGPGMTFTFGDHMSHCQHPHQLVPHHRAMMAHDPEASDHVPLTCHSSFGGEKHSVDQHQNLRVGSERMSACRMASAPGTFSYQKTGSNSGQSQQLQHRSSTGMPTIHRQNSTSDPQLHILHQDSSSSGVDTRMMGMYAQQQQEAVGRRGFGGGGGGQDASSNNLSWAQSRSFEGPAGGMKNTNLFDPGRLNLLQSHEDHLLHGTPFESHMSNHSSFESAGHPSGSFEDLGSGILHSMEKSRSFEGQLSRADQYGAGLGGGDMDIPLMHAYYQQQQEASPDHKLYGSDNKPYGSDQSLFISAGGRIPIGSANDGYRLPPAHMMGPRNSSPDLYNLQISHGLLSQHQQQPSPPQPSPPQQHPHQHPHQEMFSQQQHQQQHDMYTQHHQQQHQQRHQPQQQDMYQPQMSHHRLMNSISPVMMVGGEGGLGGGAPSPPHPEDQLPVNMPAAHNNPRQTLYYHLCGLFPKAKVIEAMQRMPNETQVEKLFSCILSL